MGLTLQKLYIHVLYIKLFLPKKRSSLGERKDSSKIFISDRLFLENKIRYIRKMEKERKEACKRLQTLQSAGWNLSCEDEDYRVIDGKQKEIAFFFGYLEVALFFLEAAKLLPWAKEKITFLQEENRRLRKEAWKVQVRAQRKNDFHNPG